MPEEGASYSGENRTSFGQGNSAIPTKADKIPSSSEEIERRLQQQIDDINSKRKRDTDLLNGTVCISVQSLHMKLQRKSYRYGPRRAGQGI